MADLTRRSFLAGVAGAGAARRPAKAAPAELTLLEREFQNVPNPSRLRMHWYIFGPAWTAAEAERQLELMSRAGIGGVLIFPTYPVAADDPARGIHNQKYLSAEFLETLKSVVGSAAKLGLTVDIVIGAGWPFGGPSVTLEDAAKMLRQVRIPVVPGEPAKLPGLKAGEKRVAVFDFQSTGGEIQVFDTVPTGMQVKRASWGAEGLVIDHYSPLALRHYLEAVAKPLVEAVPKGSLRSLFCDSLEVYRANWTTDFPGIFQHKRGYNLVERLPALFDDAHPDARDLRSDFWRTLSEQAVEGFLRPLHEWAARREILMQVEAYGTPPVSLAGYREVDIPVGEHYEWKEFNTSRWASSGARLACKRVVPAEAWTWLGLPNRFANSLEDLKRASDLHFLSGLNALIGITNAYSPISLGSPGWIPYFGPVVNHTSPYWPYFSRLADY
ncbi:MAG: hypothetical protein HY248_03240, partial [Fimbriimonas ginsengisoli]|nr:hypothetical protein [Fimbriimonas ginsengisoli]